MYFEEFVLVFLVSNNNHLEQQFSAFFLADIFICVHVVFP